MLTDSRFHPRVETDFPVQVGIPGDNTGARIINISLGGIAVWGNHELESILKLDNSGANGVVDYVVSFSMPGRELSEICRLVRVRRLSQDRFEFGLKFVDLNPQDMAIISEYVDNHARL